MPHGFEYIVRPYQSPGSLGSGVIPATPKGTRERAHLLEGFLKSDDAGTA